MGHVGLLVFCCDDLRDSIPGLRICFVLASTVFFFNPLLLRPIVPALGLSVAFAILHQFHERNKPAGL